MYGYYMDKHEKLIREKRLMEATKKGLMGSSGKLGTIVKYLGHPIIRQGAETEYYSTEDIFDLESEESIPVGEDSYVMQEGWVFDGLSRGMHLEIKYLDCDKKLSVYHEGFRVYEEIAGDLEAYAPDPEWENLIERLYKAATERKKIAKEEINEIYRKERLDEQRSFLQRLRSKWGL